MGVIPGDTYVELTDLSINTTPNKKTDRANSLKILKYFNQNQVKITGPKYKFMTEWMRDNADLPSFDQAALDLANKTLKISS